MNKTDRMLAIILELQRNRMLRAEDLADRFETSVRTIYRDVQALSEAGVPIIGAPGTGYSLMEGYFLPPISFTVEEAVTLLIGTDFIEQRFDQDYEVQAQNSRKKIEAVLPERVRSEADRARQIVRLMRDCETDTDLKEKAAIKTIRQAILEEYQLSFKYNKPSAEEGESRQSLRSTIPHGLVLMAGVWILIAYCEFRQATRHFRLSRMEDLTIVEDKYRLPLDFRMQDYIPKDDRSIIIRVQASPVITGQVKESKTFYMEDMLENAQGMLVTLRVRMLDEVWKWVLGWGAEMEVLEPVALRERVQEEAQLMIRRYT